jgi:hypothetical protein
MSYRIQLYRDGQVLEAVSWPDLASAKERVAYLILVKRATGATIAKKATGEIISRYGDTGLGSTARAKA